MLPQMGNVLNAFEQTVSRKIITTITNDDMTQTETETTTTIRAVIQVAEPEIIAAENLDSSKRYITVHTKQDLEIDDIVVYSGRDYRCVRSSDWGDYGYRELIAEEVK